MKRYYIHILIFYFIAPIYIFAQEYNLRDKFAFSMNCSLPKTTNNSAFKTTFNGIGDLDASINYRLNENFELSAGCRYAYFQLNSVIFKENIIGKMENYTPLLSFSWIKPFSDYVFLRTSISGGYNFETTKTSIMRFTYFEESFYFKPSLGLYMFSSENLSFGIIFSYNTWFSEFSNNNIDMSLIPGMNANSYRGNNQTFCVGFGFYSLIKKSE